MLSLCVKLLWSWRWFYFVELAEGPVVLFMFGVVSVAMVVAALFVIAAVAASVAMTDSFPNACCVVSRW